MAEKSIVPLLLLLLLSCPVSAKSIKCVDSKGITHYGDTIPRECADRPVTELDDKGVPVKEDPAHMTPDERRAMEIEVQKEASETQKARDLKRRDKALLGTYANEAEIDAARDRNLQQIHLALGNVEARLKVAKDKLGQENAQARNFSKRNQQVPADLAQSIQATKKEVADLEVERVQKQQDLAAMKEKFEADKKRYGELTQKQPAQQQ
ncbi:MAG TPA: DUF4124 domain-containing protein [Burkholderiales bacterium]|nr:DUF4124 domain-containing protein [Burkholderiales bacterium]